MSRLRRLAPSLLLLAATLLASGCGSDGGGTDPTPDPSISLQVSPTSVSVQQGASATVTATITGAGGFSGGATVTIQGLPSGVSFSVGGIGTQGSVTTGTVTVAVAASVAPGTYPLTVRATGPGVTPKEVALQLTVTPAPDFALTAAPTSLSVDRGASATATVTASRTAVPGPITLAAEGVPTDVTVAFAPQPMDGATSTATVTVGAQAPLGVHTLTIRGTTANAGARTTTLQLTVNAPQPTGDFSLAVSPAGPLQLAQGGTAQASVQIARSGGFTGGVDLSVSGAPGGLDASLASTSTTGDAVGLTLTAGGSLAAGTYTLTLTGTGGPGTRTATFTVQVTAPSSGPLTLDFSGCDPFDKPIWLAFQDGLGASWTQIAGVADRYEVNPSQSKVGVAWVSRIFAGAENTTVHFLSATELSAWQTRVPCDISGRRVTGSIVNTDVDVIGLVTMGGAGGPAVPTGTGSATFSLLGIAPGPQDLLAYLSTTAGLGPSDRVLVRRDLDPADGAVLAPLDATGAEASAPASATMTVTNQAGNEAARHGMLYATRGQCRPNLLYNGAGVSGGGFTARGVPASIQRADDMHGVFTFADDFNAGTMRKTTRFLRTLGDRSLTLPPPLPTPTITTEAGPYKRLRFQFVQPGNYDGTTVLTYFGNAQTVTLSISVLGYIGSSSVNFVAPDFGAGYDPNWAPGTNESTTWVVSAFGGNSLPPCTEGAELWEASIRGNN